MADRTAVTKSSGPPEPADMLRAELDAIGAPIGVSVVMPGLIPTEMNPIGAIPPSAVAANVVDAIRRRRDYVFTDDHHTAEVEARLRAILGTCQRVHLTPSCRGSLRPTARMTSTSRAEEAELQGHVLNTGATEGVPSYRIPVHLFATRPM